MTHSLAFSFASLLASAVISVSVAAQSTTQLTLGPTGTQLAGATWATISGDGRYVAFVSTDPSYSGVVVRELATGAVSRASVTAAGVQANQLCFTPRLSRDGRFVAFASVASNLSPNDTNGTGTDVFLKDMVTGTLTLVSANVAGAGGNAFSGYHDLSADGRFVSFYSTSTNLVPNDTDPATDAYLFDRITGQLELLSVDPITGLGTGVGGSGNETSISGDGRFVVLQAKFGTVIAAALLDRTTGVTQPIGIDTSGTIHDVTARVSAAGNKVVFTSYRRCHPLDADNDNDVYVLDVAAGTLEWVSKWVAPAGTGYFGFVISGDGTCVSLWTFMSLLPADTNTGIDSYLVDLRSSSLELVTVGVSGQASNDESVVGWISDDGRKCQFVSEANNLFPGDTNNETDVFVRDRAVTAGSQLYGTGLAGTTGAVPGIALLGDPQFGTTPSLLVANVTGNLTAAIMVMGLGATSQPTPWLGTLLVQPLDIVFLPMPSPVLAVPLGIPDAFVLNGLQVFFQSLVIDGGAPQGYAFTRGLRVTVGG